MKFKQYLINEDKYLPGIEQFFQLISTNCKEFIKETKLYLNVQFTNLC